MFQPAASATPVALVLKHARGRQQAQPSRTTGPSCDDTMHFHFFASSGANQTHDTPPCWYSCGVQRVVWSRLGGGSSRYRHAVSQGSRWQHACVWLSSPPVVAMAFASATVLVALVVGAVVYVLGLYGPCKTRIARALGLRYVGNIMATPAVHRPPSTRCSIAAPHACHLTRSACPRACHVSHRSSSGWQDSTVMEEDESSDGGLARVVACTRACLLDAAVAGARHSIADDRDDGTLEGDMEFTPVGGAGGRGASPATDQLVRRLSFSRAARQRHRQRTSTGTGTGTASGRRATQRAEAPRREGAGLCQACAGRGMPGCVRVTRVVWLALVQLCGLKFLRLLGRLPRATMRHAMQRLRQLRPRLCPSARRSLCSALVRPLACLSCCLPPVRMRALRALSVLWGWGSMVTSAVCVHSVCRRPTAGHRTADAGDGVAHTPGS